MTEERGATRAVASADESADESMISDVALTGTMVVVVGGALVYISMRRRNRLNAEQLATDEG